MYRRNAKEILYYVSKYPLAEIAETPFLKCGTQEAIDVWYNISEPTAFNH